jgi:uncharacterized metal-binding protein YceD (DUF177 family)
MTPEFSRKIRAEALPREGRDEQVEATPEECAAIAVRLQIPAVERLVCDFRLQPITGGRVAATVRLQARLTRTCVVSLDDFPTEVTDLADLVFVPADLATEDDDPDTPDELPFDGGFIDLGETATEQLALALEPYPRKPGAELDPTTTDVETSPFAALAHLRRTN